MRLENKVILITGSATGIGKAIAKRCVAEGARVVVHGLEVDLAAAVVAELGAANAVSHIEDLTSEGCPQRLVDLAIKTFGRLDAIVNNAAMVTQGNIHNTDAAYFMKMISVNTLAPFLLIQAALEELSKTRGSVLNIGSVNAWSGEPDLLPYSISKGALMTMTRNLGDTLMRENGVRVNQINPGWVLTENEARRKREHGLREDWYADLPKMYAPSGRILWPEEIAAAAVYWLADESGPVSGQVMDLEQHPFMGRNPPKDSSTIPSK
ncbi:NAD(P)-dependent dehydrogenase (short-subunit alcohol dehydrogenase family) [Prosthecobacter fusiformis]|uniref:NAD(P)-dependent dehydrogenase (Short-subunit alcohol dehydrogenase family) n=1 Tax=Prosthecobacter fusiformis TaxID=48464 RepID=A0A4R7SR63_9BACT|nr:SDR family oxidoreductase [Prosthecobacter fusiformis]TDU81730.1 NAD(P)-dependent dehydrogenase (short-subunit alcohol dehydrogenase family) [Prosthecobacter fusiformis]